MKERVTFGAGPRLEGLFEPPDGEGNPAAGSAAAGGVVVSHPHPLYGGTMVQPVVHHIAKACRSRGFATLRFNFRGVEGSEGEYEGVAEKGDVQVAAGYLRERIGPDAPLVLAGYSYGASMSALAAADAGSSLAGLVLVAFPVVFQEIRADVFAGLGSFVGPVLSVCGEYDDIAPPSHVGRFLREAGLRPREVVIPGCDHLFAGGHGQIEKEIARFLAEGVVVGGIEAADGRTA